MQLRELPVGARFRFPEDPEEVRRTVVGAGGTLVMVETWGATERAEGAFLGTLEVVPVSRPA